MINLLPDIIQRANDITYSFGYLGIAFLVLAGTLRVPIPTEITLPLAGFLVSQGRFSFLALLAWTTAAAVAASLIMYALGRWLGEERLRRFVKRYGRFVFVRESDLDKAGDLFERHGGKAVLIGRLVPGITSLISIPAGIYQMRVYGWFMVFTVLDSILWNGAFIGLGWALGSQWRLVEQYASILEYVGLAVVAVAIVWLVWRRWKERK